MARPIKPIQPRVRALCVLQLLGRSIIKTFEKKTANIQRPLVQDSLFLRKDVRKQMDKKWAIDSKGRNNVHIQVAFEQKARQQLANVWHKQWLKRPSHAILYRVSLVSMLARLVGQHWMHSGIVKCLRLKSLLNSKSTRCWFFTLSGYLNCAS